MYRSLLLLLIALASSAPQSGKDSESDITYVKIQPISDKNPPAKTPYRESRIKNLSLTVPNVGAQKFGGRKFKNRKDNSKEVLVNESFNTPTARDERKVSNNEKDFFNTPPLVSVSDERNIFANEKSFATPLAFDLDASKTEVGDRKTVEENVKDSQIREIRTKDSQKVMKYQKTLVVPEELRSGKNLDEKNETYQHYNENGKGAESNLSKRSPDTTLEPNENESKPFETSEEKKFYLVNPEKSFVDTPPSVLESNERKFLVNDGFKNTPVIKNKEETSNDNDSSDKPEEITEKNVYLEEIINETEKYESRTRAPTPRFLSKLSYFNRNDDEGSIATNFIERSGLAPAGYRTFISKCRCDKIWNCPKLQITVGRCPNEYFLCC